MVTQPRWLRAFALAATTVVLSSFAVALPVAAQADTAPSDPSTPTTVSSDALPTVQVDGVVWTQLIVGDTVYVGGEFTQAQPAGAAAGVDEVPRSDMLAYNLTTGTLITSFAPSFNAQVKGLAASPDGKTIYAVGYFTQVNGLTASHVVALDAATGAVNTKLASTVRTNAAVFSVVATDSTVYLGGGFTTVNGVARTRAAAISATTGAVTGWAPAMPDGLVRAMVLSPDGSKLVIGGSFSSLNGSTSPGEGLGAVDASTGASLPWNVGKLIYDHGTNSSIESLWSDGVNVYGTGYVYGKITDGNLEGTFSAGWADGTINWIEDCHGDTYSVATLGDAVYTVSHAHFCGDVPDGFGQSDPSTSKAAHQRALAFSKATVGTLAHDPYGNPYADFGGQPAPDLLTWYPDLAMGSYTGQDQAAWSVTAGQGYVLAGGEFPSVNGKRQTGLVRFAVKDIAPNHDGPTLSGANWPIRAVSLSPGTARISWTADYDRDNAELTYRVYRDNGTTPVYTTTAVSHDWWVRPSLGFVDTGLTPGDTHTYKVKASDVFGNTATSATTSVTVSAASASSAYSNAVTADGASDYWRFGEGSGSTIYDWAGHDDLTAGTGVTLGATGAIANDTNTAASFSGATDGSSSAAETGPVTAPSTFSVEAWFKTTSTSGGKIVGFGDMKSGSSWQYDRHVYMDTTGHVLFGVNPASRTTVKSASSYNDGTWHAVVASLGSDGMQLFLDGKLVASKSGVTSPPSYSGYWRVGGDSTWSGAKYFTGTIDDVAVYGSPLSAAAVANHFALGTGTAKPGPAAAFTATAQNLDVAFDASGSTDGAGTLTSYAWDFGDGATGNGTTVSHSYTAAGTYPVTLTVKDDNGASNAVTKTVTVTAPNVPPKAAFTASPNGLTAAFDASGSSDSDGTIASYAWNFGDGTTGSGQSASHTYAAGGTYTVKLTVTDDAGASDTAQQQLTVAPPAPANVPPSAAFTSSVSGLAVSVDGSGSSDSDGSVASYAWDFGDGGSASGKTASHTYAAAGSYSVKLTVTDDQGATDSVSHSVTVAAATSSTVLAKDAFGRTVASGLGTADTGGTWTATAWAAGFSVNGSTAVLSTPAGRTLSALLNGVSSNDTDVQASYGLSSLPSSGSLYASLVGRQVGSGFYSARTLVSSSGAVTLQVMNGSTALQSKSAGLTYAVGDQLRVRLQATGTSPTTIQAKVWKVGDAEPSTWTVSKTDSTAAMQAAGSIGIGSYLSASTGNGPIDLTVDDLAATGTGASAPAPANVPPSAAFTSSVSGLAVSVDGSGSSDSDGSVASYAWDFGDGGSASGKTASHTYAAAGSYSVKLTVTDDQGATDSVSHSVTVAAATSSTVLAKDAFGRTVASGLGTADTGGTWTVTGSTSSIGVGSGTANFTPAKATTLAGYLGQVASTATDVTASIALPVLPQGGTVYAGLVARRVGSQDYNGRILVAANGAVTVQLLNGGTTLKSATASGLTAKAGSVIHLRVRATGTGTTTLQARAWLDGDTEPTTWQVTATDTTAALQSAGSVGIRVYLGSPVTNGPLAVKFDDFEADTVA